MPRWQRVLRGMLGTGISFAMGLSGLFALAALGKWGLLGVGMDLRHLLIETILTGTAPGGFVIGVGFSGALALTSRGRSLRDLSATHFALLGAGAGLLFPVFIGGTSSDLLQVLVDGTFFSLMGGGAAAGTFFIAKRDAMPLARIEEVGELGMGEGDSLPTQNT